MIPRLPAIAAGIWLLVAPAVLEVSADGADHDRTVGPIIASLAFVAVWPVGRPLRWATLPLGAWLMLAPLLVDYGTAAGAFNPVACGSVVVATVPFGGPVAQSFGGGWRSLVTGND